MDPKQKEFQKFMNEIRRDCKVNFCLFPNKSQCSSKIIKAHSVQRGGILNRISENGLVLTYGEIESLFTNDLSLKGIKIASTFRGFCSYHDQMIFRSIEMCDYQNTAEQNFLFAYRALICEYSKKYEAINAYRKMFQRFPAWQNRLTSTIFSTELGIKDILHDLKFFDKEMIKSPEKRNYNIIYSKYFSISFESLFAVNSTFALEYDFEGNQIIEMLSIKHPEPLFINIFPQNGKTHVIFSCFASDLLIYKPTFEYLASLSEIELTDRISLLMTVYCENFFFSPAKWRKISKIDQKKFLNLFKSTLYDRLKNPNIKAPINYFNLFKNE